MLSILLFVLFLQSISRPGGFYHIYIYCKGHNGLFFEFYEKKKKNEHKTLLSLRVYMVHVLHYFPYDIIDFCMGGTYILQHILYIKY